MARYSTVIFDLDGTLLNTLEDLTAAVNHAMRACGYPEHTMDEVCWFVGNGIGSLIRRAMPPEAGADPEAYERTLNAFRNHYALHNNDATAPYAGVCELLAALRAAGVRQAVVSNKNDPNVKALCRLYFSRDMELAVGEREGVRRKPAPDMLLRVMEAFEATPETTLYVGDSDTDIQTAVNAGVDCASVTWGFRPEAYLRKAGAKQLFSTPRELGEWILQPRA